MSVCWKSVMCDGGCDVCEVCRGSVMCELEWCVMRLLEGVMCVG